jgi:hypothetical protein
MSDDINQSKRKPWTHDPEVLKQVWGEKSQLPEIAPSASQRLVLQRGSIWPTTDELDAYNANALPDSQTFTRAPIIQSNGVATPQHHTPIASKIAEVTVLDGAQQLIDSVLSTKEAKDSTAEVITEEAPAITEEAPAITVEITPIATRMKEAKDKLQGLINRHKA